LLPENLNPLLRNSIFFGHVHHWFEVESTNLLAGQAASANQNTNEHPEGEVFLAEEQTAGKGRGLHSWYSERGAGIYCSIVVRPQITPSDALWLSLIAGVAVQDAVKEVSGLIADIRWPNDLLMSEKKFCGILAEINTEANRVNHAVIGIGINVNHGAFPEELRNLATSLRLESGKEWSRVDLTAALLKSFDREYRGLLRAVHNPIKIPAIQFGPILKKVEARSSYAHGKLVHVNEDGGYSGTTDGLDPRGFLRVRTNQGLRIVISGSVRPLRGRTSDVAGC
jgi:BirA family biotin operon repressor/biotin-[acetyl-CoA-carboxylase] ligase